MIQKALEKAVSKEAGAVRKPFSSVRSDLLHAVEVLASDKPAVVVVDTKGYFVGELEKFRAGCEELFCRSVFFKVLAVGNPANKESFVLADIVNHWCIDHPFDPMSIVSVIGALIDDGGNGLAEDRKRPHTDDLMDNLKGFLNVK